METLSKRSSKAAIGAKVASDLGLYASDLDLYMERMTGIEPALSAWESVPSRPVTRPDLRCAVPATDRERPLATGVNGTLMARRTAVGLRCRRVLVLPVLLDSCHPSGRGRCVKAREATACGLALTQRTRPRQSSSEEDGINSRPGDADRCDRRLMTCKSPVLGYGFLECQISFDCDAIGLLGIRRW
jgi:hypothetical protein